MKKWLIRCLTVLAMVCLIPGIVLKAAAETTTVRCKNCGSVETREVLGYRIYDSNSHRFYVAECQNCHNDGNVMYLKVHTGGTVRRKKRSSFSRRSGSPASSCSGCTASQQISSRYLPGLR